MADDRVRSNVDIDGELRESLTRAADPLTATEPEAPIDDLDHLVEHGFPDFSDDEATRDHLAAREAVVATLREALAEHEPTYVDTTSRTEFERAERLVWTIDRGHDQFRAICEDPTGGSAIRIRDSAMAAQVEWLLAITSKGTSDGSSTVSYLSERRRLPGQLLRVADSVSDECWRRSPPACTVGANYPDRPSFRIHL